MTLRDEIFEQPGTLEAALGTNRDAVAAARVLFERADVSHVVIAARGTSDNAARYAKYVWGARNRMVVALAAPSLVTHYGSPPDLRGALVVGISQSGESPDLVAVVEEGRRQGRPTIAITNEPGSPLAAVADVVLDINAGEERAVAATKTYTAQLLAIAMVSDALDDGPGLHAIPEHVAAVLTSEGAIEAATADFVRAAGCAVLGRGFNLSTAFEWALKLQEITYVLAHPYSTADFRHGPMAVVEPGFPVLSVAPGDTAEDEMTELLGELAARGATTLVMSDRPDVLAAADHGLTIGPGLAEWLTPIVTVVGAQLFTYHLGLERGHDPDRPRGLTKVTRTV